MFAVVSIYLGVYGGCATEVHLRSLPPAQASMARACMRLAASYEKSVTTGRENLRILVALGDPANGPMIDYLQEREKYLEWSIRGLRNGVLPPPPPDIGPALFAGLLSSSRGALEQTRQTRLKLEARGDQKLQTVIDSLKAQEERLAAEVERLGKRDLTPAESPGKK